MLDLVEILNAISKNKSKAIIAGITVAWGVLLLILLVGTGEGLQNAIKKLFSDYTIKTIEVIGGQASISDSQVTKGQQIFFRNDNLKDISANLNSVTHISPLIEVQVPEIFSEKKSLKYFSILGVNKQYFDINRHKVFKGRYFNDYDGNRKIAVIGYGIAEKLFNNANCVGRLLFIKNVGFKIIGVLEKGAFLSDSEYSIYIPYENALNFSNTLNFSEFVLSLNHTTDTEAFQKTLKSFISKRKGINPNDKTALLFNNIETFIKSFNTLFNAINLFLWFIGLSFLVSGMLGVFNVMTVIVKDRIGEFGIRKAVGASPKAIQNMVLVESLIVTLLFGIIGLVSGFILIYLINWYILISQEEHFFILSVNIYIIMAAVLLLILSGCIAGIIPARKASKIRPVEALRALNN